MPKLPIISGKDVVTIMRRYSYEVDHQTGSHMILRSSKSPYRRLTVPNHKELSRGTLRAIIRQAGLTREEFMKNLGRR